jgi:sugar phosphate isomerase/epimerase
MAVTVGNAAAPRWFDLSLFRLEEYVEFVHRCGATSTELVLHSGPSDDRIARVHILEEDWFPVLERFHAWGIACHVHAPLDPRFNLSRWRTDRSSFQREVVPILRAVSAFAERQNETTMFVVHAASGIESEFTTRPALEWIIELLEKASSNVRIAIELRRPVDDNDARFDRDPNLLADFVLSFGHECLGICWDLANDHQSHTAGEARSQTHDQFLACVNHVHLHDIGKEPEDGHHPLSNEKLNWRPGLRRLIDTGYAGAVTLEVRYRHALAQGDPWTVLADSYNRLLSFLNSGSMPEHDPSVFRNSSPARSTT